MSNAIVVLNSGSSSIKFSLFLDRGASLEAETRGQIEGLYTAARFVAKDKDGAVKNEKSWPAGAQLMQPVASAAEHVRANRRPVAAGNPFLQWEKNFSQWMELGLEAFRKWRDMLTEQTFFTTYSQPWMQAMLGLRGSDGPARKQPGQDSDHAAFVERSIGELKARMDKGGPPAAAVRALIYVCLPENAADERVSKCSAASGKNKAGKGPWLNSSSSCGNSF